MFRGGDICFRKSDKCYTKIRFLVVYYNFYDVCNGYWFTIYLYLCCTLICRNILCIGPLYLMNETDMFCGNFWGRKELLLVSPKWVSGGLGGNSDDFMNVCSHWGLGMALDYVVMETINCVCWKIYVSHHFDRPSLRLNKNTFS